MARYNFLRSKKHWHFFQVKNWPQAGTRLWEIGLSEIQNCFIGRIAQLRETWTNCMAHCTGINTDKCILESIGRKPWHWNYANTDAYTTLEVKSRNKEVMMYCSEIPPSNQTQKPCLWPCDNQKIRLHTNQFGQLFRRPLQVLCGRNMRYIMCNYCTQPYANLQLDKWMGLITLQKSNMSCFTVEGPRGSMHDLCIQHLQAKPSLQFMFVTYLEIWNIS